MSGKTEVAIIGSGNIGTDPQSDRLKRAARMGIVTTAEGLDGLVAMPGFRDIGIVFDATSAGAHRRHSGGQEDMIVDVALDLARERDARPDVA